MEKGILQRKLLRSVNGRTSFIRPYCGAKYGTFLNELLWGKVNRGVYLTSIAVFSSLFLLTSCVSHVAYIPKSEVESARSGTEVYNLSEHQRRSLERAAATGDVHSAQKLADYYEMVALDERQYQHWQSVVDSLKRGQNNTSVK
jgi:hypothetical protein